MSLVSIIVPCFNEQDTIRLLLESLYSQTYPRQAMEVIVADGLSTDRTREEIALFQRSHPDLTIHVVDNPKRIIPAGLNQAIAAAQGDIIIRLDGHSIPKEDYVSRCVAALKQNLGDNVGGVWEIHPRGKSWQARAIAAAASHPLGAGDARYRLGGKAQAVDTVPFGAFYQSLINRIGGFDESLLTNEDYEFNTRIRQAGGSIWLDPRIRSVYIAPANMLNLIRQYWRYGFWKARMLRRYPGSIRWRQALPPVFVVLLVLAGILALWFPLARWFLWIILLAYTSLLLLAGLQMAFKKRDFVLWLGVPLAIAAMHFSWGTAFLYSLVKSKI